MRGDPLLTVKEATGRYFQGLSQRHVLRLARAGTFGPLVPLGRVWLINETLLVKWLKAREATFSPAQGQIPNRLNITSFPGQSAA
jgi:hypothetical protein